MAVGPTFRGDIKAVAIQAADANKMFIAHHVAPIFGSNVRSGQYPQFKIGAAMLLSSLNDLRNQNGSFNEVQRQYELKDFTCEDRGLEERVDRANQKDMARFFRDEARAAQMTTTNLLLNYEKRVATMAQSTSNFSAVSAISPYTNANLANIDFAGDILARIDALTALGTVPDTIVIPQTIASLVGRSAKFQNYVKGFGIVTPSDMTMIVGVNAIQKAFEDRGITKVLIGRLSENVSKGATPSMSSIWSPQYIWVGRTGDTTPTFEGMDSQLYGFGQDPYDLLGGAMRTFVWNEMGGILSAQSYSDEARDSDIIRIRQYAVEKVIDSSKGSLVHTSYA
jgi:hypothetical protein